MIYRDKHLANEILLWWQKTVKEKHFRNAVFPWPLWKHIKSLKTNIYIILLEKSKFAQLRPKCVVYSSDLPQYVYTCIYHENFMLILQALHRIDSIYSLYSHDLPNKFVCFQPNDDCWFNKCNQCKYALMFCKNYLLQKNSTLQQIRWYQWENAVNSAGKKTIGEYWRRL